MTFGLLSFKKKAVFVVLRVAPGQKVQQLKGIDPICKQAIPNVCKGENKRRIEIVIKYLTWITSRQGHILCFNYLSVSQLFDPRVTVFCQLD